MATVYRALDRQTGRIVAVKLMRTETTLSVEARRRFAREVELTNSMDHVGILKVIATGEVDGRPYYAMPFVDGPTLKERLAPRQPLTIEEAVDIAAKLGEALAYAHALGIIHRDIKPANILLDGAQPMLADFGIARALNVATGESITQTGLVLGTVQYMSPEQASSEKVDGKADLYSLGCVLYEMLIGSPPFEGSNSQQVMARHAAAPVPGLRVVRNAIPAALERVVLKSLEKTPADRYANAAEFVVAVRAAERETLSQMGLPKRKRGPRIAAIVIGAVAVIGALYFAATRTPPLDPNRVLVLPLVVPKTEAGESSAGEDAASMIGAAIDGVGALRSIDGWRLLDPAQRRDVSTLSAPAASALARRSNAGYVLSGRISAPRLDSVDVYIDLLDATGASVASAHASAPRAEAWRATLRAVNGVLPQLIKVKVDASAGWQDRSPKAVAAYLQGEAAYRRLQMPEALTRFREALGYDSLLTPAAIRGALAASWNHSSGEAAELAGLALRHQLSPRDAFFARGLQAYVAGSADSAAHEFRRAIGVDSTMTMAWVQLGETFTHLLPYAGAVDSMAANAFERARALDSAAAPPLVHLAERAARDGNAARAESLIVVIRAGHPDTVAVRQLELMQRCAATSNHGVDWSGDAQMRPRPLLNAATILGAGGRQLRCAMDGFRALLAIDTAATSEADGRRFSAVLGLIGAYHARGQADSATLAINRYVARWHGGNTLFVRQALVDTQSWADARRVVQDDSARTGPSFVRSPFSNRIWAMAMWSAHDGRRVAAEGAARELSRRADSTHDAVDRRYAQSVMAHVAIMGGDTAKAISLLTPLVGASIPEDDVQWREARSMADERLLLARVLLARRDAAGALAVANVFDSYQPAVFLMYLAPSLQLRIVAAEALGDAKLALRLRGRLKALGAA